MVVYGKPDECAREVRRPSRPRSRAIIAAPSARPRAFQRSTPGGLRIFVRVQMFGLIFSHVVRQFCQGEEIVTSRACANSTNIHSMTLP